MNFRSERFKKGGLMLALAILSAGPDAFADGPLAAHLRCLGGIRSVRKDYVEWTSRLKPDPSHPMVSPMHYDLPINEVPSAGVEAVLPAPLGGKVGVLVYADDTSYFVPMVSGQEKKDEVVKEGTLSEKPWDVRYRKVIFPDNPKKTPFFVQIRGYEGKSVVSLEASEKPFKDVHHSPVEASVKLGFESKSTLEAWINRAIAGASEPFWVLENWSRKSWVSVPEKEKLEKRQAFIEALKSCRKLSRAVDNTVLIHLDRIIKGLPEKANETPDSAGPTGSQTGT